MIHPLATVNTYTAEVLPRYTCTSEHESASYLPYQALFTFLVVICKDSNLIALPHKIGEAWWGIVLCLDSFVDC